MYKNNPFTPGSTALKDPIYTKPLKDSLIELKNAKGSTNLLRQVLELCATIEDHGKPNDLQPKVKVITFGALFDVYNYISSKFFGILLKARKHGLVYFEGEMLYQGRDDDVPIFLVIVGSEIKKIQKQLDDEEVKELSKQSHLPLSTAALLGRGKPRN